MKNFWKDLPKPFTVLAPMEDVTDLAFRQIVAQCGRPDVFFTEFTNVEGLISKGRENVARRLAFKEEEKPIVAQIWGSDPEAYRQVAKELVEMGFSGIDINMGCPVRKVVRRGQCSGLIENPTLAAELIQATKEGAGGQVPISVKTRLGLRKIETESWIPFLLEQKLDALTVHGRVAKEMSKFPANWDEIGKAVKIRNEMKVNTLIIGNGDLQSLQEIYDKHDQYKIDGGMVGRGIFANPFIFNKKHIHINNLSPEERKDLLLRHTRLFVKTWGKKRNFAILKRFFKIYINSFEGSNELRNQLMQTSALEEVEKIIGQNS